MKTRRYMLALLSCLCLLSPSVSLAAHTGIAVHTLEGLVVGVSEGDRVTVNSFGTEIHVKLYGVAAPQTAKIDKLTGWYKPGQPYGDEAFRALSTKVLHQQVKVEIRQTLIGKHDPQQVAVAVLYLDGRNINMEMLAEGWAWAYRRFTNRTDYAHYAGAERVARSRKLGLWLQENPQPPWEFKPELKIRNRTGNRGD